MNMCPNQPYPITRLNSSGLARAGRWWELSVGCGFLLDNNGGRGYGDYRFLATSGGAYKKQVLFCRNGNRLMDIRCVE